MSGGTRVPRESPREFPSFAANLSPDTTVRSTNSSAWCWNEEDIQEIFCEDCGQPAAEEGGLGVPKHSVVIIGACVGESHRCPFLYVLLVFVVW